jgi:hypothetical protein
VWCGLEHITIGDRLPVVIWVVKLMVQLEKASVVVGGGIGGLTIMLLVIFLLQLGIMIFCCQ